MPDVESILKITLEHRRAEGVTKGLPYLGRQALTQAKQGTNKKHHYSNKKHYPNAVQKAYRIFAEFCDGFSFLGVLLFFFFFL